ncbi:MAG: hypothetical protein ACP5JS_01240 [Fervidobacterium sp.]
MKTNYLVLVLLVLLSILFTDVFTKNSISNALHAILSNISLPIYQMRRSVEKLFEKQQIILTVVLFGQTSSDTLEVLSEDLAGIYVRNLRKKGIVLDAQNGELIGFVQKTGSVGYVIKWWETEFPVTIESTQNPTETLNVINATDTVNRNPNNNMKIVGYYRNYKIEIPDPNIDTSKLSGKVYMSEHMPYGKLLKESGISVGEYKNGLLKIKVPKIPRYVILLEDYNTTTLNNKENGGN